MKRLIMFTIAMLVLSLSTTSPAARVDGAGESELAGFEMRQTSDRIPADLRSEINALNSSDPIVRATAACSLRRMRERAAPAIPYLIRMLGDDTPTGAIRCEREGWRGDGEDSSPGKEAAMTLACIGRQAVEPLISVVRNGDHRVRMNSIFALGVINDERTVDPVIAAVNDPAWQVREKAAWGLGLKKDPRVAEALVPALRDAEWQVRSQAAWALGLQGNHNTVGPLSAALTDENSRVRSQAAWALGLKGDSQSVEPLMAALKDENDHVRSQAAWALGLKGDHRAVEDLTAALKDESSSVRSQAAWALGLKGDYRAVEALNTALKDEDARVRKQAAWALGMILMRDRRAADVVTNLDLNIKELKKGRDH